MKAMVVAGMSTAVEICVLFRIWCQWLSIRGQSQMYENILSEMGTHHQKLMLIPHMENGASGS